MKIEALEEKYPQLKSEFPEMFIFFISSDGELNDFGKMAEELYRLRRQPQRIPGEVLGVPQLDCIGGAGCKATVLK